MIQEAFNSITKHVEGLKQQLESSKELVQSLRIEKSEQARELQSYKAKSEELETKWKKLSGLIAEVQK